jgi:DNA polymerase-1
MGTMTIRYSPTLLETGDNSKLIYGMSSGSLQYRLNKTFDEALEIANRYWNTFPRIKPWLMEIVAECKDKGYVTYWDGRRWYEEVEKFMYKGANATIQGGSHDLLMMAFIRMNDLIDSEYTGLPFFNLVHDEIDIEVPPELLPEIMPKLQKTMEVSDIMGIPFFTDPKVGDNYGDMFKWEM